MERHLPLAWRHATTSDAFENAQCLQHIGDLNLASELVKGVNENTITPVALWTAVSDDPTAAKSLEVDGEHFAAVPLDVSNAVFTQRLPHFLLRGAAHFGLRASQASVRRAQLVFEK